MNQNSCILLVIIYNYTNDAQIHEHQVPENYISSVFKLLIFSPLLRTTYTALPIIPHYSLPNSTSPPVRLYQEDERALSGTLQSSKLYVSSCNNHNEYSFFWYIPRAATSVCLSVFREFQAPTFSYSRCWTCPCSWRLHRQFTAPDSSSLSSMSAVLYWMFAPQTRRMSEGFPVSSDR